MRISIVLCDFNLTYGGRFGGALRGFDVVRYAMAVSNELLWALDGLVEESE